LVRKWKRPKEKDLPSSEKPEWEWEIGEEIKVFNPEQDLL